MKILWAVVEAWHTTASTYLPMTGKRTVAIQHSKVQESPKDETNRPSFGLDNKERQVWSENTRSRLCANDPKVNQERFEQTGQTESNNLSHSNKQNPPGNWRTVISNWTVSKQVFNRTVARIRCVHPRTCRQGLRDETFSLSTTRRIVPKIKQQCCNSSRRQDGEQKCFPNITNEGCLFETDPLSVVIVIRLV